MPALLSLPIGSLARLLARLLVALGIQQWQASALQTGKVDILESKPSDSNVP